MPNRHHPVLMQTLRACWAFSVVLLQTTASKMSHFYFCPPPSAPAISLRILLFQSKRT